MKNSFLFFQLKVSGGFYLVKIQCNVVEKELTEEVKAFDSTQVFSFMSYKCFHLWDLILGGPNLSGCLNLGAQAKRFLALAEDCSKGTPFKQPPCQS